MASSKRARTVAAAAYEHLQVFTQPVHAWPKELAERIPTFQELYLEPEGSGRRPSPIATFLAQLERVPGPIKLLLTGQKGAGKSWSLQYLREKLSNRYRVVWVATPETAFTNRAEIELADLLVLLCEALSAELKGWKNLPSLATMNVEAVRWVRRLNSMRELPIVPDDLEKVGLDFNLVFAKVSTSMRSDSAVRKMVRDAGVTDLQIVAAHLLETLQSEKPVLVIFDDLDKLSLDSARRLFGPQFSVLESLPAKMVLTFPYALNAENVLSQRREVLRNVQVLEKQGATEIRPEAKQRFTELLLRLVEPDLIDGLAVEEAVKYSGGITREFGRILARAFEFAYLAGDERVLLQHTQDAVVDLRIEMERATQDKERRASLSQIYANKKLDTEMDRRLLDENMVVEYVNGHTWYDVHPLLVDVVKAWKG